MTDSAKPRVANAQPTKEFFINMLVKDVELFDVIPDLIDNSVDGAKRSGSEDFTGFEVRVEVNDEYFKISDNCGGISVEVAENYAFRFGRDKHMDQKDVVAHSTGLFGVGMKRAIFKLGRWFWIESTSANSRFVIEEDIEEWASHDRWEFEFKELEERDFSPEMRGTVLYVRNLHDTVASDFAVEMFLNRLRLIIRRAHLENLDKGLAIIFNGLAIEPVEVSLLASSILKPAVWHSTVEYPGKPPVTVRIYAGISDSGPSDAGWYVFCNGRLVLDADKSFVTGWGETTPNYHNQYARFRGYVYFDSEDATLLPWNTTKDGVDSDSPIYRQIRREMISIMKPIIGFLNAIKKEKQELGVYEDEEVSSDPGPREKAIMDANPTRISSATIGQDNRPFVSPTKPRSPSDGPKTSLVKYKKPREILEKVKNKLGVKSYREVGEMTFDYYCALEIDE